MDNSFQNKTILQLIPRLDSGGVERGAIEIAKYLKSHNFRPVVASNGGRLVVELEKNDIIHITLPLHKKNPLALFLNYFKIRKLIKEYNVDIVHARSRAPAWSSYFAAKHLKVKFVTTFHGIYNFSSSIKKFYNSVMTFGTIIIATSEFTRKHILDNYKVDLKKITVIHRGYDETVFDDTKIDQLSVSGLRDKYKLPIDKTIILLPSRFATWKGQEVFVKALSTIHSRNYHAILVGDQSRHPSFVLRIKELIKNFHLESHVTLADATANIIPLYKLADIVVSPSIEPESFGRTIIEAQCMKCIVIASNHGGPTETILPDKTGFVFKPGDAVDLAQTIDTVLQLPLSQLTQIKMAAQSYVKQNFTTDLMCKKTIEVYKQLLS